MIIFSPRLENYQFSQPRSIFLIYDSTIYVFSIYLCGKAASGLDRILSKILLKEIQESMYILYRRYNLLFTTQSRLITPLEKKAFENIVEKGENAGNQHFLLFPQCFLLFPTQISVF